VVLVIILHRKGQVVFDRVHQKPHPFSGPPRKMKKGRVLQKSQLERTFGPNSGGAHRRTRRSRPYLSDDLVQRRKLEQRVVWTWDAPLVVGDRTVNREHARGRWLDQFGIGQDRIDRSGLEDSLQLLGT